MHLTYIKFKLFLQSKSLSAISLKQLSLELKLWPAALAAPARIDLPAHLMRTIALIVYLPDGSPTNL